MGRFLELPKDLHLRLAHITHLEDTFCHDLLLLCRRGIGAIEDVGLNREAIQQPRYLR